MAGGPAPGPPATAPPSCSRRGGTAASSSSISAGGAGARPLSSPCTIAVSDVTCPSASHFSCRLIVGPRHLHRRQDALFQGTGSSRSSYRSAGDREQGQQEG